MSHTSNRPVDWETLVTDNENRLYRAAIHLFYYEGYSTEEIARITGQRPGTVRSRLFRARQKLKTLLEE